jgi:uncharacterized membrane-anchored protein YitT (DUF2179 family)
MKKHYKADTINWGEVLNLKNFLLILTGVLLAVFSMKGFMIPNKFMDGGITGISLLLKEILHINISLGEVSLKNKTGLVNI